MWLILEEVKRTSSLLFNPRQLYSATCSYLSPIQDRKLLVWHCDQITFNSKGGTSQTGVFRRNYFTLRYRIAGYKVRITLSTPWDGWLAETKRSRFDFTLLVSQVATNQVIQQEMLCGISLMLAFFRKVLPPVNTKLMLGMTEVPLQKP